MTQLTDSFEKKFPRLALVIWPLIPTAIATFAYFTSVDSLAGAYVILFLTVISSAAAFFFSIVALPYVINRLKSNPIDRTSSNYLSVGFLIAFDLTFIACAFVFMTN
jgi:hypothetical protein